jgi:hypothetical protein
MRNNYAFDCAAEIETDLDFDDIPIEDLCRAMRERLDRIEKRGDREAFGFIDSYEVEDDGIQH